LSQLGATGEGKKSDRYWTFDIFLRYSQRKRKRIASPLLRAAREKGSAAGAHFPPTISLRGKEKLKAYLVYHHLACRGEKGDLISSNRFGGRGKKEQTQLLPLPNRRRRRGSRGGIEHVPLVPDRSTPHEEKEKKKRPPTYQEEGEPRRFSNTPLRCICGTAKWQRPREKKKKKDSSLVLTITQLHIQKENARTGVCFHRSASGGIPEEKRKKEAKTQAPLPIFLPFSRLPKREE